MNPEVIEQFKKAANVAKAIQDDVKAAGMDLAKAAPTAMTRNEWYAEGTRLFGKDVMKWRFVCPSCGHIATVQDWHDAGADEDIVAFNCIGRSLPERSEAFGGKGTGPCNYTGGGLFNINPIRVGGQRVFAFAPLEEGE